MRTCISAPTRLSRLARTRPVISPEPEKLTSALGALATISPWASRTTMSRMRSAVRPLASRSSCVPPTAMRWWLPKFSSIAAVSQGVAISKSIGPLPSRHHSAIIPTITTPPAGGEGDGHAAPAHPEAQRREPPGGETELCRCQVGVSPTLAARGSNLLQQVKVDAGLKLAQGRDVRIRVLIRRHAPTGRPLDRRVSAALPRSGPGLLPLIANSCEIGRSVSTLPRIV